jgi:DNA-binding CsgD family transcriptional regulator
MCYWVVGAGRDTIAVRSGGQRCQNEGERSVRSVEGESAKHHDHNPVGAGVPSVVIDRPSVQQFVAEVVAAKPTPKPFTGFVELTNVLLDIEIEGVRCIVLKTQPPRSPTPALTARELEIARMVARGLPNKSMASVLQISTWTVSSHLRRIFAKLDVTTRAEMVGRLLEEGKFQPSDLGPSSRPAPTP